MEFIVKLDTINRVKEFVSICGKYNNLDIDLQQKRYVVDAKSIMGVFSLDLSKNVKIHVNNDDTLNKFLDDIKDFIVEE